MKKPLLIAFIASAPALLLAQDIDGLLSLYDKNKDGSLSAKELSAAKKAIKKKSNVNTATILKGEASSEEGDLLTEEGLKKIKKAAKDAKEDTAKTHSTFSGWFGEHIGISKSYLSGENEDATNPAKLTWTHKKGEDTTYALDLAVRWKSSFLSNSKMIADGAYSFGWDIAPTFEAHVNNTSDTDDRQNKLLYQVPIELSFIPEKRAFLTQHTFTIAPRYETDRENLIGTAGLRAVYSPTIPKLAIGTAKPLPISFFGKPIQYRWRPWVGVEFGSITKGFKDQTSQAQTVDGKTVTLGQLRPATERDFGFAVAEVFGELSIGDDFSVTADFKHLTELYGGAGSHSWLDLSAVWHVDGKPDESDPSKGHLSLGVSYVRGETGPKFEDDNTVELWIGLQF